METDHVHRKIIRGLAWETSTRLIIQGFSWLSTFLVARLLSPEDYGVVAISGIFTGVFSLLTNMGLAGGLVNKREVSREEQDGVFWLNISAATLMYLILFTASPYIGRYYHNDQLSSIIRAAALVLVFSSLNLVPMTMAIRSLDFRFTSLVELFTQLITTAFTLGLAYTGYGPWSLVVPVLIGQGFSVLVYARMHTHIPSLSSFRFKTIKPIAKFGATLMTSRLMEFFSQSAATFVSGTFLGTTAAGYYFFGSNLANIPISKLGAIFKKVAFPALSSIKRSQQDPKLVFLKLHRYLILISFPILIGIALVAKESVTLLVGAKWAPSIPPLQLLCYINLLSVSALLLPATLEGCGNPKAALRFQLLCATVLPIALYLGAQRGLLAMMYAWCVCYPFIYFYLLKTVLKELHIPLREFIASCSPTLVASLLMITGVTVVDLSINDLSSIHRLLIKISVGAICYLGGILLFFPQEIHQAKLALTSLKN